MKKERMSSLVKFVAILIPMPGKKIKKVTTRQEKKMRNKLTPMANGLSIKKPVILRMV